MTSYQNAVDWAKDQVKLGKLTTAQANVQIIKMIGVRIVNGKIPNDVRKALNEAVKHGELGHIKKDGLKPECYFHPNSMFLAKEQRNKIAIEAMAKISGLSTYNIHKSK